MFKQLKRCDIVYLAVQSQQENKLQCLDGVMMDEWSQDNIGLQMKGLENVEVAPIV
jgi:hypothetical protein